MRENRMLRSTWRGLETWFGRELINAGAPVPDPTDERGGETERVSKSWSRSSEQVPAKVKWIPAGFVGLRGVARSA